MTAGGLRTDQGDGRVDYRIDEKNSLFGSISWSNTSKDSTPPFQGALDGGNFYGSERTGPGPQCADGLYAHLDSRRFISETRIGFSRLVTARTQANAETDEFKAIGIGG